MIIVCVYGDWSLCEPVRFVNKKVESDVELCYMVVGIGGRLYGIIRANGMINE